MRSPTIGRSVVIGTTALIAGLLGITATQARAHASARTTVYAIGWQDHCDGSVSVDLINQMRKDNLVFKVAADRDPIGVLYVIGPNDSHTATVPPAGVVPLTVAVSVPARSAESAVHRWTPPGAATCPIQPAAVEVATTAPAPSPAPTLRRSVNPRSLPADWAWWAWRAGWATFTVLCCWAAVLLRRRTPRRARTGRHWS